MQSGSTVARVVLVLVASAASIGLASLYFSGDGGQSEPASTEQPASPTVAERTPGPTPEPTPDPVRPPDPSTPPLTADPAPQAAAPAPAPEPPAPATPPAHAPAPEPVQTANAAPADSDLVDINTASVDEINRIKGVGLPGKSIAKHRPYKSVEELLTKKAVKPATFKKIKDKVTVR